MSYMSFENSDLDQTISLDLTIRQAIHIMSLLSFHLESGLSVDEEDMMGLYEELFAATEPFGKLDG